MNQQRENEGIFPCDTCNKIFTQSGSLKQHKLVHTGERHFQCFECNKSFKQPSHLKQHRVIHTGQRPFQCGKCSKMFKQSCHLRQHQRLHTGERPYQCNHCYENFTQSCHLKRHKRFHTDVNKLFQCDKCNETFTESSDYKVHRRGHLKKRLYQCEKCCRVFKHESHLKRHKLVHIDKRPYQCTTCQKSYKELWYLKLHARKMFHMYEFNDDLKTKIKLEPSENAIKAHLKREEAKQTGSLQLQFKPELGIVSKTEIKVEPNFVSDDTVHRPTLSEVADLSDVPIEDEFNAQSKPCTTLKTEDIDWHEQYELEDNILKTISDMRSALQAAVLENKKTTHFM